MKRYSLVFIGLLLTAGATLSGCRKEKGDPNGDELVSARAPMALSQVRPEDAQAQSLFSQALIAASLKKSGAYAELVDTLAPTILITTLLNASENETSEKLVKSLGIHEGRHDKFTKSVQAQLDHLRTKGKDEAKFSAAFWMVWPILLTPDFQEEFGEKLGVSIYRLGNPGITSSAKVSAWGKKHSPDAKRFKLTLDKKEVMLATTVSRFYPHSEGDTLQTSFQEHQIAFVKTGEVLETVRVTGPNPESLLGKLNLTELRKQAKPVETVRLPFLPSFGRIPLHENLKEAGFGYLFEETNDWRYMAMELRGNGLSRTVSFTGVRWKADTLRSHEPNVLVMLWVPESGLVLAGAKSYPLPRSGT